MADLKFQVERAGFKNICVHFEPVTDAKAEEEQQWIDIIKNRCPINDNLISPTPVQFELKKAAETLL